MDLMSLLASFREIAYILVFTHKLVLTIFTLKSSNICDLCNLGSGFEEMEIVFNLIGFDILSSIDGQICLRLWDLTSFKISFNLDNVCDLTNAKLLQKLFNN